MRLTAKTSSAMLSTVLAGIELDGMLAGGTWRFDREYVQRRADEVRAGALMLVEMHARLRALLDGGGVVQ